jgi:hypothetical protein
MTTQRFHLNKKSRGHAEVVDMAPNGSWVVIEFCEYTKSGNAKTIVRCKIDVYDAANIARRVHEAVHRQVQHVNRIGSMARGEGY